MPLNPDRNHFSVAPVGNSIIIGRAGLLKGGLSRENALNLIGWLVLATNAKPEDIKRVLADASKPTKAPQAQPAAEASEVTKVPPAVTAFIGSIDPEEKAALQEAAQQVNQPASVPSALGTNAKTEIPKTTPVDEQALTAAWGG